MRRGPRAWTALLSLVLAAVWAAPAAALSESLEAARREGLVGEQVDGYLGLPKGEAPAAVKREVDEVNAKRRAMYQEIAGKRGVDAAAFAAITGKKLVEESPPGSFVRGADGSWIRR